MEGFGIGIPCTEKQITIVTDPDHGTPSTTAKQCIIDVCGHEYPPEKIPEGVTQVVAIGEHDVAFKTKTHLTVRRQKRPQTHLHVPPGFCEWDVCDYCKRIDLQELQHYQNGLGYYGPLTKLSALTEAARFRPNFESSQNDLAHHASYAEIVRSAATCPLCCFIMFSFPFKNSGRPDSSRHISIKAVTNNTPSDAGRGLGLGQISITFPLIMGAWEGLIFSAESFLDLIAEPGRCHLILHPMKDSLTPEHQTARPLCLVM
jgi:hypothetical protein